MTSADSDSTTPSVRSFSSALWVFALLFLALLCYFLPWWWSAAAGLTAQAFDLAEFVGLSPAVRGGNPPMLAPLLLRLPLAALAVLFYLRSRTPVGWLRWLLRLIALALLLTFIPPIEFVRVAGGFDDPNYRQLFFLLIGTFAALLIALWLPRRLIRPVTVIIALLAAASAIAGSLLAFQVIANLRLATTPGIGVIGFVICLVVYALAALRR
ncbi:MAG: hypothetical protein KF726_04000 [Anaerolineae bacterium]|nr:hypothetical protein [Anaerolineae bacterium]